MVHAHKKQKRTQKKGGENGIEQGRESSGTGNDKQLIVPEIRKRRERAVSPSGGQRRRKPREPGVARVK